MSNIRIILVMLLPLVAISLTLYFYLRIPIVVKSYSSGECVDVLSYKGNYSCDNMPKKYILEWVK